MQFWPTLFDIGALLGVAFVLGALCERLRQSALLGYLLAGMLLGPNALDLVSTSEELTGLAEVGVCLVLFSLGLEFSWRRLRSFGPTALGAGVLQVGLTLGAVTALSVLAGLPIRPAVVIGAAFALSSTAGVVRLLMARAEIDSVHGRHALGILLFQDLAVVPLVLLTGFLGTPGSGDEALRSLGKTGLKLVAMVVSFYIVFNHLVPRVLLVTSSLRNRELPVLFAAFGTLSSIYVGHELGISPAVGAFIAGMLLGGSPFATQIRADLGMLRTLLVTVFFSSVGMLADPRWIVENAASTLSIAAAVIAVKGVVCFAALLLVRQRAHSSLAAALCLSQVGEFAFVIGEAARGTLIDDELFMIIVSTMIVTLGATPYLIAWAPSIATLVLSPLSKLGVVKQSTPAAEGERGTRRGHVVLIGYGPAGQMCGEVLRESSHQVSVLDLNPRLVAEAEGAGFEAHVGDGTHPDVLEHVNVDSAAAVIVAIPDTRAAENSVRAVRSHTDRVPIVARSRYHKHVEVLEPAGANAVVDEEREVGELLGRRTLSVVEKGAGNERDGSETRGSH